MTEETESPGTEKTPGQVAFETLYPHTGPMDWELFEPGQRDNWERTAAAVTDPLYEQLAAVTAERDRARAANAECVGERDVTEEKLADLRQAVTELADVWERDLPDGRPAISVATCVADLRQLAGHERERQDAVVKAADPVAADLLDANEGLGAELTRVRQAITALTGEWRAEADRIDTLPDGSVAAARSIARKRALVQCAAAIEGLAHSDG